VLRKTLQACRTRGFRVFWRRSKIFFETPVPHGSRKLSGTGSLYRIRAGEYRIIYDVCHESMQITILSLRHRRTVYRGL